MTDAERWDVRFRYLPVALGLGGFLAISYVACTLWDAVFPGWAMRAVWAPLLPRFRWWTWGSFFLGLLESVLYGFWIAFAIPAVRWIQRLGIGELPRTA